MFSISENYPGLWPQIFEQYEIAREINGRRWAFQSRRDVYPIRQFCLRLDIQTIGM